MSNGTDPRDVAGVYPPLGPEQPRPDSEVPDDERMTDAELRVVREYLGLTTRWLADHLGVAERTVHRWEHGHSLIPDGVRIEVERLEAVTAAAVGQAVEQLMDVPDPTVATYRTDEDMRAAHPESDWPASWHRAVVARAAQEVTALGIVYRAQMG